MNFVAFFFMQLNGLLSPTARQLMDLLPRTSSQGAQWMPAENHVGSLPKVLCYVANCVGFYTCLFTFVSDDVLWYR